jgi:uncharacterized protein YcbK (DUF882 family)
LSLPLRLPENFVRFSGRRVLTALSIVALLALSCPAAHASKLPTRRHPHLRAIAYALLHASLPDVGFFPMEPVAPGDGKKYELKLASENGGEIDVVYRIGDTYIPQALDKLNQFLRDQHNEDVSQYDPRTFDLLHTMLVNVGKSDAIVNILSAYRSQETNDALRASGTTNAAKYSQHILGKAIDIRVEGVPAAEVRDAALSLKAGGVGFYPSSQFVHVDVGPVRQWTYTPHARRWHRRRSRRT